MRAILLLLAVRSFHAGASPAQDFVVAMAQTEEPVVGLLRLPEIYGEYPCQAFKPQRVPFYAAASGAQPPIGFIERVDKPDAPQPDCEAPVVVARQSGSNAAPQPLPFDESGYEFRTAVVYERSGAWFRIALAKGSAWIQRRDAGDFVAYPDALISDSFSTYLRPGWSGEIRAEPARGATAATPPAWQAFVDKEVPIRVLGTRVVDGKVWIRLRFESETCGQTLGELPTLEAWTPAHRSSGATSIWFHSRGC
ncbi:MAG TPA: hypothetical protein VFY29_05025 [Terriglobia bacterium]|nr:hypothetical protein [Terriglobia bacterium]